MNESEIQNFVSISLLIFQENFIEKWSSKLLEKEGQLLEKQSGLSFSPVAYFNTLISL